MKVSCVKVHSMYTFIEGHGDLSCRDIGIQLLLDHLTIHMLVLVNLPIILSGMRVQIMASR